MESKKSIQLNQAFGAVLTLVLVAVLVIVAIVIFVSLETSFEGTSTVTVTNESGTLSVAGDTVDASGNCSFGDFAITTMWNTTGGAVIPVANYTVDASAGTYVNATVLGEGYQSIRTNFTYTYTWGSEACTASEDIITEFGNYTSLIGLVGTIIFLGLVIGVLVTAFAFGGRKET